jgi:hypothetical protein
MWMITADNEGAEEVESLPLKTLGDPLCRKKEKQVVEEEEKERGERERASKKMSR